MHRTQIMLEDDQYEILRAEASRTGRSLGDLIRVAIDERHGRDASRLVHALERSTGAWADRDVDPITYVERVRSPGIGNRLKTLGWD